MAYASLNMSWMHLIYLFNTCISSLRVDLRGKTLTNMYHNEHELRRDNVVLKKKHCFCLSWNPIIMKARRQNPIIALRFFHTFVCLLFFYHIRYSVISKLNLIRDNRSIIMTGPLLHYSYHKNRQKAPWRIQGLVSISRGQTTIYQSVISQHQEPVNR